MRQADVQFSPDGAAWFALGRQTFAAAPGTLANPGQTMPLLGLPARYVRIDVLNNYGDATYTGLNEVEVYAGAAAALPPDVPIVSARASSELAAPFNRRAGNAVDRAGQTTTSPDGWPSDPAGMWLTQAGDASGSISFDLQGLHKIDAMLLYNYNEPGITSRGVQEAEVFVSKDNVNYASLGTMWFNRASGDAANPGQIRLLGGVEARYVRMRVLSNYGDVNYSGLNEVQFFGAPQQQMPMSGVSVTASSSLFEGAFDRRPIHLIDGTGLFAGGHSPGKEYGGAEEGIFWLSAGIGFGQPGDDPNPELVFDLGSIRDVQSARIWNYNEGGFTHRGVRDLQVLGSADGLSYSPLGTFTLAQAPGADGVDFSQSLLLNAGGVRFLKFDILSNYNGALYPNNPVGNGDAGFVGLSEVRLYVPEPGTWALLAVGAVTLAPLARRRRASAARKPLPSNDMRSSADNRTTPGFLP